MKKLLVMAMAVMLVLSLNSTFVFAADKTIDSVAELKKQISESMNDGEMSASEKEYLKANTDERTAALFISEKLDKAVNILNNEETTEMEINTDGSMHSEKVYALGDNCSLIVELSDMSEDNGSLVSPLATSGSSEMWKAYGNRYFTARATVSTTLGSAELSLENHYILSANGIDENYGVADSKATDIGIKISAKSYVIGDRIARTPGASDVNMHNEYTINVVGEKKSSYKLNTAVKYLAIDKTNKKIKVGHAWNLTKM